ncbi:MAG TPA: zinc-binding dehydrogenase [Bacteroidota bacterium]|nr:zinc-binding dehydrogenase [Bacteroidota bacterium]
MNAVRFSAFGEADVLRYEDAPVPEIGPGEVLIKLKAAALNHLDLWVRKGERERNIPLPHIPGSDGAGFVAEIGAGVDTVKPGDSVAIYPGISCNECEYCRAGKENLCRKYAVLGTLTDGTYAEFVKIPARCAVPFPPVLKFTEAASVPAVFLTAWHMLCTLAQMREGDIVLVHGAGSGVGSAAIQIAKAFGARVITTAGSKEKLAKAKALGADDLINYNEQDFAEEVKKLTAKRGVDIVFEHIGGEVFQKSLPIVRKGGRIVTCGATAEYAVTTDLRYVYFREVAVLGSFMGTRAELEAAFAFFEQGKLHPVVDSVFPLAQAADAQRKLESRTNFGKIVLSI